MLIKIPTREVAKILKTGQITSYVAGDDGDLQIGIDKEYLVLTTGQFAGTINITINGKTDVHNNNCVLDLKTGKMYSRYVSASVGPGSDGKLPWTTTGNGATAEGIFPYVAAAKAALLAGYSDWRIPYDSELASLRDMEAISAIPDVVAFPTWLSTYILWSSVTSPNGTTNAIGTRYDHGGLAAYVKTLALLVILVRGGN